MNNSKLIEFIGEQLAQGKSREEITEALLHAGWKQDILNGAWEELANLDIQRDMIDSPVQSTNLDVSDVSVTEGKSTITAIQSAKLPGVLKIARDTFQVLREHGKRLFLVGLIAGLVQAIFYVVPIVQWLAVVLFSWMGSFPVQLAQYGGPYLSGYLMFPSLFLLLVFFTVFTLGCVYLYIFPQAVLLTILKHSTEPINLWGIIQLAHKKFFLLLWTFLLVMGMGLVTQLLLLPGIWFVVVSIFTTVVVIAEDKVGIDALRQSMAYVRGSWWRMFLHTICFMTLPIALMFVAIGVSAARNDALYWLPIITGLIIPVTHTYLYVLYERTKSLKGQIVLKENPKTAYWFNVWVLMGILVGVVFIAAIVWILFSFAMILGGNPYTYR